MLLLHRDPVSMPATNLYSSVVLTSLILAVTVAAVFGYLCGQRELGASDFAIF